MVFTDKTSSFKMYLGNVFILGIFTSVITSCLGFECATKLSLKATIEPTLYPSYRMHVKNMFQCDTACRRDPKCVSGNYDYENKFCDLNTFQQSTTNAHLKAKHHLQEQCQDTKDDACADCGQDRRCVRTAESFKCLHDDVTTPLAVVDCGNPGVIMDGTFNYSTTTYSSQGQIVCNTGYNFSQVNNTISCTANGTWDLVSGSCQAINCGPPMDIPNGFRRYNSTTYGSLCHLSCNPGFTGVNNTITCGADGNWETMTGHGSCDVVNCGSPRLLPFGSFNYSSTTYGSPSHLLCNTGYRFAGTNNTITCRVDGTWDPISGSCDVVNCGSPALIRNGANNCSSSATTYGALCYLVCNTGYTFTGANDTIVCTDAGDWETYSGSCVADCGTPTVENALVSYNGTIYGSKVRITCVNETFLYDGNASVECNEHGQWATLPVCRKNVVSFDDWVLLLRATAGNGVSVYDMWNDNAIYNDHPVVPEDLQPGCFSLDTSLPCDTHFKSKLVTAWETFSIQQIKVVILKANEVKAEILFNGEDTTRTSWFSKTQMINSTWTDLKHAATFNYFSIPGLGEHHRRFYINNLFNGCPGDIGWMLIKDKAFKNSCDWEKTTTPTILFSKALTATLSTDWESADVMAVLAQLGSQD